MFSYKENDETFDLKVSFLDKLKNIFGVFEDPKLKKLIELGKE